MLGSLVGGYDSRCARDTFVLVGLVSAGVVFIKPKKLLIVEAGAIYFVALVDDFVWIFLHRFQYGYPFFGTQLAGWSANCFVDVDRVPLPKDF